MTHQEFNNIYYSFTGNKQGIRPYDNLKTTGYELKEFLEFAIRKLHKDADQQISMF